VKQQKIKEMNQLSTFPKRTTVTTGSSINSTQENLITVAALGNQVSSDDKRRWLGARSKGQIQASATMGWTLIGSVMVQTPKESRDVARFSTLQFL
jgi:hypothetical protein